MVWYDILYDIWYMWYDMIIIYCNWVFTWWHWSLNLHKYRKGTVQISRKGKIDESSLNVWKPSNLFKEKLYNMFFSVTRRQRHLMLAPGSTLFITNWIFHSNVEGFACLLMLLCHNSPTACDSYRLKIPNFIIFLLLFSEIDDASRRTDSL
jgi:hypothetical protein